MHSGMLRPAAVRIRDTKKLLLTIIQYKPCAHKSGCIKISNCGIIRAKINFVGGRYEKIRNFYPMRHFGGGQRGGEVGKGRPLGGVL